MPTVIDSLLIELGLDSTKFDAAQKKSIESLRKFDDANQKSSKGVQENSKKASEGVLKTKDAIDSLNSTNDDTKKTTETVNRTNTSMGVMGKTAAIAAVAIAGFKVLKDFSVDLIDSNAQLGRMSALLGESPQQITAWGTVLKGVGGTADDFTSSMQNIEGSLARLKMGFGGTQILRPLGMLGVALSDAGNPEKIQAALQKYSKLHGEQQALVLAQEMGINGNTFQAMINRSGTLKSQYAHGLKAANVDKKETDRSEEQLRKIAEFTATTDGAAQAAKQRLNPAIDSTLNELNKLGEGFNNNNEHMKENIVTIAALIASLGAAGIAVKALRLLMPAAAGAEVAAGAGLVGAAAGGAVLPTIVAGAGGYFAGGYIKDWIDKQTERMSGTKGETLGTLLYSRLHGEGGTTLTRDMSTPWYQGGGWSKSVAANSTPKTFDGSTKEAKLRALESKYGLPVGDLSAHWQMESSKGKNKGLSTSGALGDFQLMPDAAKRFGVTNRSDFDQSAEAAAKYKKFLINKFGNPTIATGAYFAGEGNMDKYLARGMMPPKTASYMNNYDQLMGSNVAQSGKASAAGGSKVETNIQAINIHTQATDANGIAKSARQALHDHQLIGTATLGVM